ncbi:MAG TPA: GNAT family N-acetyltransferase, partial [Opitutaceae bacterium]
MIHAVGRYYLDADGRGAEVAFVVRETRRRFGMGSVLMDTLIAVARNRGLRFIWGRVCRDNLSMLVLFKRFGNQPFASPETAVTEIDVRIPLDDAERDEASSNGD